IPEPAIRQLTRFVDNGDAALGAFLVLLRRLLSGLAGGDEGVAQSLWLASDGEIEDVFGTERLVEAGGLLERVKRHAAFPADERLQSGVAIAGAVVGQDRVLLSGAQRRHAHDVLPRDVIAVYRFDGQLVLAGREALRAGAQLDVDRAPGTGTAAVSFVGREA